MTVTNVEGFGTQGGHKEYYRNAEYAVAFIPKIKIEIVVENEKVENVIKSILQHAKTGKIGDGEIFIYETEGVIRVRTGEKVIEIFYKIQLTKFFYLQPDFQYIIRPNGNMQNSFAIGLRTGIIF